LNFTSSSEMERDVLQRTIPLVHEDVPSGA